jgi:predicted house-cleaning noncanonical NTP pyrophosphatase (MazG superfamily)
MKKEWKKLVRDLIPAFLQKKGIQSETRILEGEELIEALRAKVLEESQEVFAAQGADLTAEMADLIEVVSALAVASGVTMEEVEAIRLRKREERGAFEKGVWLEATEE